MTISKDPPLLQAPKAPRQAWKLAGWVSAGLLLVSVAVILLKSRSGPEETPPLRPARATPPPQPDAVAVKERSPLDPPAEVEPGPPRQRLPEGVDRWGMARLPEGWNPAVAGEIARAFALMDIGNPADVEKLKRLEETREALKQYLASLGPEAIPTLHAILRAEPDFVARRFLLAALGELGPRSEEATFALIDYYENRLQDGGTRSELNTVIDAMGRLKNDTAYQHLNRLIDDPETNSSNRDKLVQALGDHPRREESLPVFLRLGSEDSDINTRNHSWQAVGKIGPGAAGALGDLITAFDREPLWPVQQTILGSIGKIGDGRALPVLERVARTHENPQVRLSAASQVWRLGAFDLLRSIIEGERDAGNRAKMQGWLDQPEEK